jgi:CRP-like cAMP-binding protein
MEGYTLDKKQLAEFLIFSGIPQDKLSSIAGVSEVFEFKADEIIFSQDDNADNLYGVLKGEVELSLVFKEKILKTDIKYEEAIIARYEILEKPIVVDTIDPGEVFGWSSLIGTGKLTSTAKSTQLTRVFSIPATDLKAILDQDNAPGYIFMKRLAEVIAQRLRSRTEKLIEAWGEAFEVGG